MLKIKYEKEKRDRYRWYVRSSDINEFRAQSSLEGYENEIEELMES